MADTKRGRPRLDAQSPTVPVSVYLPSKTYDRLCVEARRDGGTLSEYIRQVLNKNMDKSTKE